MVQRSRHHYISPSPPPPVHHPQPLSNKKNAKPVVITGQIDYILLGFKYVDTSIKKQIIQCYKHIKTNLKNG